jgi:tetratricopeptide (TPR) repeat protein
MNLGAVYLMQKRYGEALDSYREGCRIFESLGEPGNLAICWHQIGWAYEGTGQFEQAEQAYRKALAIRVQQQDRANEASDLLHLGNLYLRMARLEESATFYRRAADIFTRLHDQLHEGTARSNLANVLVKLQRYDEARHELRQAIERKQPFGHAAGLWGTWYILQELELAIGDATAAESARTQAINSYLAYRRAGGESKSNQAELFTGVFYAIKQGATTEAEQYLAELSEEGVPLWLQTLLAKLQAILRGDRDPALAADPNLGFCDVVDLRLLLEKLEAKREE